MVGDKGSGRGTPGNGIEEGGFHLQESPSVQLLADQLDNPAPLDEGLPDLGIDHEVHIALPVTHVGVLEAMVFFGQGPQGLGQKGPGGVADGDLAHTGPKDLPGHGQKIAQVQLLPGLVVFLAQIVQAAEDLNAPRPVQEVGKGDLAHTPLAHEPAGHGDFLAFQLIKGLDDIQGMMADLAGGQAVGTEACLFQFLQLVPPETHLFGQVHLGCLFFFLAHAWLPFGFEMRTTV